MKTKNTKRIVEKTITLNRTVELMFNTTYKAGRVIWRERATEARIRCGWPVTKNGFVVVFGHGMNDVIPLDALTMKETVYDEIVTVTKKNVKTEIVTVDDLVWR